MYIYIHIYIYTYVYMYLSLSLSLSLYIYIDVQGGGRCSPARRRIPRGRVRPPTVAKARRPADETPQNQRFESVSKR